MRFQDDTGRRRKIQGRNRNVDRAGHFAIPYGGISITMTKIRMFMFAVLAVMVAFAMGAQPAFAQDLAANPHIRIATIGRVPVQPDAGPDATSLVHQGITAMGILPPPDSGGLDSWPCFGGGPDCPTIAVGGMVVADPFYTWPLTNCTSSTTACGQIYWTFETDVASTKAPINVSITVTQGTTTKTTIMSISGTVGTNPGAGYLEVVSADVAFGPGNCMTGTCGTPVAGPATIRVVTTIAKQRAVGTAQIALQ